MSEQTTAHAGRPRTLPPGGIPATQGEVWKVVSNIHLDAASLGLGNFVSRHAVGARSTAVLYGVESNTMTDF